MNLNHNKKELEAIDNLEDAFKQCASLGIKFTVMNDELMFANKRLYKKVSDYCKVEEKWYTVSGTYPPIAYSSKVDNDINVNVNTHDSMDSCGGW